MKVLKYNLDHLKIIHLITIGHIHKQNLNLCVEKQRRGKNCTGQESKNREKEDLRNMRIWEFVVSNTIHSNCHLGLAFNIAAYYFCRNLCPLRLHNEPHPV